MHLDKAKRSIHNGIESGAGLLNCLSAKVLRTIGPKTQLVVVLDEGKNRHIRRMFGALKEEVRGTPLKVVDLKRTAFGPVTLDIPSGQWRFLSSDESRKLRGTFDGS